MGTLILRGNKAAVYIAGKEKTLYAISEFSIELSRDTNEQPILGAEGNEYHEGPITIEGSYTCCKFAASGNSDALDSIVEGDVVHISGQVCTENGETYLSWDFPQCMVTSYDVTGGDAATITEASIDFVIMNPKDVDYDEGKITCEEESE
jgi:hypothetical protein